MRADDPFTDVDLHRAADGCLEPARQAALESHLATHAADAEKLAFYRRLNQDLHHQYDPMLSEAIPPAWAPPSATSRWRHASVRIAATIGWLLIGAAGGWLLHDHWTKPPIPASFAQDAAAAHLLYAAEVRHPVEVLADPAGHLDQWLSKRLGAEVHAPRLADLGYGLIGGRLLPSPEGPAGFFMYENPNGTRVTLYVRSGDRSPDAAFRFVEEAGVSTWYWRDASFDLALSAELPREALLAICKQVYAQLSPADEPAGL